MARLDGVGFCLFGAGIKKERESKWSMLEMKLFERTSFVSGRAKCVGIRISRVNIVHVERPMHINTTLSCHGPWNLAFDDSLFVCVELRWIHEPLLPVVPTHGATKIVVKRS